MSRRVALAALLLACLAVTACTALRRDRTEFEPGAELPGAAVIPVGPRNVVAVEQVTGTTNGVPYDPTPETKRRLVQVLRDSNVFSRVIDLNDPDPAPEGALRVSIDSSYAIDPHDLANFFRALLVGAIGYRVEIEGRLTYSFRRSPQEPLIRVEATTRATRIYFSSGRAAQAQTVLLQEVEEANRGQMVTRLRSEPQLLVVESPPG